MAAFPLFIDLNDKLCVVVGGGRVATRKVRSLAAFGARIKVVSPVLSKHLEELADKKSIEVVRRNYCEGDVCGAFIAIAATSDSRVNEKVYESCVKDNIFIDVADCPQKCTFIFPSIVRRDDLVVGISTSGGYPALSKSVRKAIDAVLPKEYGSLLEILKDFRDRVGAEIGDEGKRKEILSRIMDEAEKLFREYRNEEENQSRKP
jgi:precorrin-2 dehydrogenase/sirohydrochlorin ferrochelatase